MTRSTHALRILAALALTALPVRAHDMWIEPTAFRPDVGALVGAKLRVGEDFLGDAIPRNSVLIDRLIAIDGVGTKPLIGRDGADPAGLVKAAVPGALVLGYQSKPSPVTLTAEKFNQYLNEEGLDAVAALRAARNQTQSGAKEVFSRCAKSLLLVGDADATAGDRVLGFTLELVAERNPYALAAAAELPVRLLHQGKPLSGALVVAYSRANPDIKLRARTDAQGRVRLRLAERGVWLIKSVHMTPAVGESGAEWSSHWASLTFDTSEPGGRK